MILFRIVYIVDLHQLAHIAGNGSTEPFSIRREITVFRPLPMADDGEVFVAAEHPV
jgi:hypothetical protein